MHTMNAHTLCNVSLTRAKNFVQSRYGVDRFMAKTGITHNRPFFVRMSSEVFRNVKDFKERK